MTVAVPRWRAWLGLRDERADDRSAEDPLVEALPDARLTVLRNTDHFATPEAFAFIDATLEFLDAVPA